MGGTEERTRLEAGLAVVLVASLRVSELEVWLVVETLQSVVLILVRGEEAEVGWESRAPPGLVPRPPLLVSSLSWEPLSPPLLSSSCSWLSLEPARTGDLGVTLGERPGVRAGPSRSNVKIPESLSRRRGQGAGQ